MNEAPEHIEHAHQAVKHLAEAVFATKPPELNSHSWVAPTTLKAHTVQALLWNSSFGNLLLRDGDSLSDPHPTKDYPDLLLDVGWGNIKAARLHGLVFFPYNDPTYWSHELEIRLSYSNGYYEASQSISVLTASYDTGKTPTLERTVYSEEYINKGYMGHLHEEYEHRTTKDILGFVAIAQQMFDARTSK